MAWPAGPVYVAEQPQSQFNLTVYIRTLGQFGNPLPTSGQPPTEGQVWPRGDHTGS